MRFLAFLFAFLAPAGAVSAGDDEERALRALLSRGDEEVAMAPTFLDNVPPETLSQVLDGLKDAIGPVARIDGKGRDYVVQSDTHRLPARIAFDAEGRVSTLWFGAPEPRVTDLASAEALLNELGQDVAWLAHPRRRGDLGAPRRARRSPSVRPSRSACWRRWSRRSRPGTATGPMSYGWKSATARCPRAGCRASPKARR